MSGLANITYRTIVDWVKTYIKSNCVNITNYSGINNSFKKGYTKTYTLDGGNEDASCYYTYTLSSNGVVQATSTDVDNDMNNYLKSIGADILLDTRVNDSEFLDFINNMVIFVCTKMTFRVSQLAQSTIYLVYDKDNTKYSNIESVEKGHMFKIIEADDVLEIFNNLFSIIKSNIRTKACIYTTKYS